MSAKKNLPPKPANFSINFNIFFVVNAVLLNRARLILDSKGVVNMMSYNMMSGANGGGMMFFSWVTYILVISFLVLGIAALWKYVSKN